MDAIFVLFLAVFLDPVIAVAGIIAGRTFYNRNPGGAVAIALVGAVLMTAIMAGGRPPSYYLIGSLMRFLAAAVWGLLAFVVLKHSGSHADERPEQEMADEQGRDAS